MPNLYGIARINPTKSNQMLNRKFCVGYLLNSESFSPTLSHSTKLFIYRDWSISATCNCTVFCVNDMKKADPWRQLLDTCFSLLKSSDEIEDGSQSMWKRERMYPRKKYPRQDCRRTENTLTHCEVFGQDESPSTLLSSPVLKHVAVDGCRTCFGCSWLYLWSCLLFS